MSFDQYDPLFLPLSAIPSRPASASAAATNKADLTNLADPTKTPNHNGSFSDFLSAINPLQHIPVVGSIYRAITGDVPAPAARVLGATLIGGPVGLVLSAANAIYEQDTGHEVGGEVLAFLGPDKSKPAEPSAAVAAGTDVSAPTESSAKTASATEPVDAAPTAATAPVLPAAAAADTSVPAIPAVAEAPPAAASAVPAAATVPAPAPAPPAPITLRPATAQAAPGRSLADYWSTAGMKTPAVDKNGAAQKAPVPLELTMPGAADLRRAPYVPVAPVAATPDTAAATSGKPSEDWVATAMMRGLDRYREMKRLEQPTQAPQVDKAL